MLRLQRAVICIHHCVLPGCKQTPRLVFILTPKELIWPLHIHVNRVFANQGVTLVSTGIRRNILSGRAARTTFPGLIERTRPREFAVVIAACAFGSDDLRFGAQSHISFSAEFLGLDECALSGAITQPRTLTHADATVHGATANEGLCYFTQGGFLIVKHFLGHVI